MRPISRRDPATPSGSPRRSRRAGRDRRRPRDAAASRSPRWTGSSPTPAERVHLDWLIIGLASAALVYVSVGDPAAAVPLLSRDREHARGSRERELRRVSPGDGPDRPGGGRAGPGEPPGRRLRGTASVRSARARRRERGPRRSSRRPCRSRRGATRMRQVDGSGSGSSRSRRSRSSARVGASSRSAGRPRPRPRSTRPATSSNGWVPPPPSPRPMRCSRRSTDGCFAARTNLSAPVYWDALARQGSHGRQRHTTPY